MRLEPLAAILARKVSEKTSLVGGRISFGRKMRQIPQGEPFFVLPFDRATSEIHEIALA
jgi:hypothetical protein